MFRLTTLLAVLVAVQALPVDPQPRQLGVDLNLSLGFGLGQKSSSLAKATATSTSPKTSSYSKLPSSSRPAATSSTKILTSFKVPSSSKASSSVAKASASKVSSSSKASSSSKGLPSSLSAVPPKSTACATHISGDAPYSLSCGQLGGVITFPRGNQKKKGGIVFLVHGTGSTGEETWGPGPYNSILPNKGPGYDIAWFTSPTRSLGDAQVNAEYIAYNIKALAQQSSTGKVWLIGHSQGNINIQWALDYWPSMRQYVEGFVSIAGDFKGTAEGPLLCTGQDLLQGGCEASVIQQSVGSKYLAAQNARGYTALVPTTSIYTLYDDIIQPEIVDPTSNLPAASVITVQQACTPAYIADHFTMTVAAPAFYLALDALTHGGYASLTRFNALTQCTYLAETAIPNPFVTVPGVIRQAALDAISVVLYEPKQVAEPLLQPYVCDRGDSSSYCAGN